MATGRIPINGTAAIQSTIFDAKGDIIAASAADTAARLAVGSDGQYLSADSTASTGLKWAAAPSSAANWSLVNSGGTALTGAATVTVSGITGADKLLVLIKGASSASAGNYIGVRFNSDTAGNYKIYYTVTTASSTYAANAVVDRGDDEAATYVPIAALSSNAGSVVDGYLLLSGGNTSGVKTVIAAGGASANTGNSQIQFDLGGIWDNSATITSVSIYSASGNLDAGTVYVYKSA